MKKILYTLFTLVLLVSFSTNIAEARTIKVKSYYKPSTGKYVNTYYKTSPNKTKLDNYSTKYNYNPFTSKKGYVNPFK
jgi:uncharacterized protein YxeA